MLSGLLRGAVAGLLVAVGATTAQAASFDPDLTWRTLQTEHFNITFHGGEEELAEEVAGTVEQVWTKMTEALDVRPRRRTEIVLVDQTDMANGYAMTVPVNTIVIFVTAPTEDSTLSLYEDWNDAILTHEFTHILHLDSTEGLARVLRHVLGRIVSVNRASPKWLVEGQATLQETRHTTGGRGRSTIADMIKRVAVLEDAFPPLGNLDGFQTEAPAGNLRYLFGQDFQQYIADEVGADVWTRWIHGYAGGVPYWLPGKRVLGQRIVKLYRKWQQHLEDRYLDQERAIEDAGTTPVYLMSDGISPCMGPEWSPDGDKIVWSCSHPVDGSAILIQEGLTGEPRTELKGAFARDFTWRSDGEAFFYSSSHVVDRFNLYDDVWFHEVGKSSISSVTKGKRARHPTLSPDGRELVAVENRVQRNQLVRLTVDRRLEQLTDHTDHTQISTPRFSPDGKYLALSRWTDGFRDIWIYTADGAPVRRVTADLAHDIDPAWSSDGRHLYFSSDRSGVFNIYAVELATERLSQVTNVIGGAFHPAPHPDGQWLVFENFTHNGTDVAWMPLERNEWWDRGALPLPLHDRAPLAGVVPEGIPERAPPRYLYEGLVEETASLRPSNRRLPSGHARATPVFEVPGLQGWGGPMAGWARVPGIGGSPYDAPDSAPETEGFSSSDADAPEESDYAFSYPVRRYNPLPTLFPPRYIKPAGTMTIEDKGFKAFVGTSSWDTLLRWMYSGYLSYRSQSNYLGWGASVAYNRFLPIVSAGAYSYSVRYGEMYELNQPPPSGGTWLPSITQSGLTYWDKRTVGYVSMAYPLDAYRALYASWTGTHRTPLIPLAQYEAEGVQLYRNTLPSRGFFSAVGGGWSYAKGVSYGRAISTEKGRVVYVNSKITTPLLGSYALDELDQPQPFSQVQFSGEWREYLSVPWLDDHVFATKVAGGGSIGDQSRYGAYRLGGNFGEGGLYTVPDEFRALRGFSYGAAFGDWYYQGSMEYRFPIWWIDRGLGTIPFFARYISGAAFIDTGYAFMELPGNDEDADPLLPQTLVGTGLELRVQAIIGYGVLAQLRTGYAFALNGENGVPFGDLAGLYAMFDTSF
jgi:hypothetical protein